MSIKNYDKKLVWQRLFGWLSEASANGQQVVALWTEEKWQQRRKKKEDKIFIIKGIQKFEEKGSNVEIRSRKKD